MGTFFVTVTVANLHDRSRRRTIEALVDTGATYTTLPPEVADALGCVPVGRRRVRLASGREEEWPVITALIELEGQELPTICLLGPSGGPTLLGAVTLEEFALGVDPTARRLVSVSGYLTATAR